MNATIASQGQNTATGRKYQGLNPLGIANSVADVNDRTPGLG